MLGSTWRIKPHGIQNDFGLTMLQNKTFADGIGDINHALLICARENKLATAGAVAAPNRTQRPTNERLDVFQEGLIIIVDVKPWRQT